MLTIPQKVCHQRSSSAGQLMYAQSYGLSELLDHCIKEFKTLVDVKKLCESGQYSLLTRISNYESMKRSLE
uniref:Uncharacterized protein n=1 Tax=Ditylenchus dipsaci TaxID=166011 RepID=A0A915CLS8_9BILA